MHDLGLIARTRRGDGGAIERGFCVYIGGGLGAVPHQAKLYSDFLSVEELLPFAQAVCRVFTRHGEKKNRARARIKFLLAKIGLDELRRLIEAERAVLPDDPRWRELLPGADHRLSDGPAPANPRPTRNEAPPAAVERLSRANVRPQKQPGFVVLTVALPLGDLTAEQARGLAEVARRYTLGDALRVTVEQNLALRWVRRDDLPAIVDQLAALGLDDDGASTIVDITACPGTDTCKLGIASSRGLAAELRTRLAVRNLHLDEAVKGLRIKISGCFNSCGQHHIADIGFYGVSRKVNGLTVPHFQLVLGGRLSDNAASYGLAIGAYPSRRIPEVVSRIIELYIERRQRGEPLSAVVERVGKAEIKKALTELTAVPSHLEDPSYYSDWGDPREFTIGDLGKGECAGEVVSEGRLRAGRQRARGLRGAAVARNPAGRARRAARLPRDAGSRPNAGAHPEPRRLRRAAADHRRVHPALPRDAPVSRPLRRRQVRQLPAGRPPPARPAEQLRPGPPAGRRGSAVYRGRPRLLRADGRSVTCPFQEIR